MFLPILAASPVLLPAILMMGFGWSALRAMSLTSLVTGILAYVFWQMSFALLFASVVQGVFIALAIAFIVFGAVALLEAVKESGGVDAIRAFVTELAPDPRVQLLLVAWAFGSFIEGAAGFGTPAAIVGPLLVAIGFSPLTAVVIALMVQSTAVTFGAVGTPIIIGIGQGLSAEDIRSIDAVTNGDVLTDVTRIAALIHAVIGTFIPVLMVGMYNFLSRDKRPDWIAATRERLLISLAAGLSFTVPYCLTAWLLGPEFPSMVGGIAAIGVLWLICSRASRRSTSSLDISSDGLRVAVLGYTIVSVLLVLSRLDLFGFGELLRSARISWRSIAGTPLTASIEPAYLPGAIFLIATVAVAAFAPSSKSALSRALHGAGPVSLKALLVLVFVVPMVRIFINSGLGGDLASMPILLAEVLARNAGEAWLLFAPFIGASGAFMAGSNTISNLMFASFQTSSALVNGLDPVLVLSLQAVGAAAANMVAVHNVVAACAVVGLFGREADVMRRTWVPTLFYVVAAAVLGSAMHP